MTTLAVTSTLIERIDRFGSRFNAARFEALASLPGNPFGVEIQPFGDGVAVKVRHPLLRGKNRIYRFRRDDARLLNDLLAWYKADGLACTLHVPHGEIDRGLFQCLTQADLWSPGNGSVPVLVPDGRALASPPEITVRQSGLEEKELYLDLFQSAFANRSEAAPEYRAFQWAEDSLPGGARYVAEVDSVPAGMASFPVVDGIGYFGTAGVLPQYRKRGIQMALIRQRIQEAPTLGCSLILGSYDPGTSAYQNFERAGLHLVPSGSAWRE